MTKREMKMLETAQRNLDTILNCMRNRKAGDNPIYHAINTASASCIEAKELNWLSRENVHKTPFDGKDKKNLKPQKNAEQEVYSNAQTLHQLRSDRMKNFRPLHKSFPARNYHD